MKILHIISSGGMYGAEAVILEISRSLRDSGHTSLVCVFANSGQQNSEFEQRARSAGIPFHLIPCRGQLDWAVPKRLAGLVESTGADVAHAHGYKADVYGWWALRRAGVPLVSTCHTWYDNDPAVRLYGKLDRLVLRRFGAVVAVSEVVRQRLLGAGVRQDRIRLIRNGVSVDAYTASSTPMAVRPQTGPLTVGLVGRLSPEKGVDIFLRAAALTLSRVPSTRFLVAGDGPDREVLQVLLEELQLEEHAILLGRQEDMPAFFGSLDLLVSSSREEGLPVAMLEGMAAGLPVIAAAVGEVPEVVQNGQTGILVPAEAPQTLSEAMIALLQDPGLRREMGINSRARVVEHFSAQRMTAEYLETYARVLKGGRL